MTVCSLFHPTCCVVFVSKYIIRLQNWVNSFKIIWPHLVWWEHSDLPVKLGKPWEPSSLSCPGCTIKSEPALRSLSRCFHSCCCVQRTSSIAGFGLQKQDCTRWFMGSSFYQEMIWSGRRCYYSLSNTYWRIIKELAFLLILTIWLRAFHCTCCNI